jgi:hypothetical protein
MKLFVATEGDRVAWVAALAGEKMYGYVPNTGKFHENNALRNDFSLDRTFEYREIGVGEARRLIETGLEPLDETEYDDVIARWRADQAALPVLEVLSMAAGLSS